MYYLITVPYDNVVDGSIIFISENKSLRDKMYDYIKSLPASLPMLENLFQYEGDDMNKIEMENIPEEYENYTYLDFLYLDGIENANNIANSRKSLSDLHEEYYGDELNEIKRIFGKNIV